jgi:hypothetical protein
VVGDLQAGVPGSTRRNLLVRMSSAGDEGWGSAQPPFARPPGPKLLVTIGTRTRMVPMAWLVSGALRFRPRDAGPRPAPRLPRSLCTSRPW